jgi:hypothetical protein
MRICITGNLLDLRVAGGCGIKGFVCETGVHEHMSRVLSRRTIEK